MSAERKDLQEALGRYVSDTLRYIHTVRGFCEMFSKWLLWREIELDMMQDIAERCHQVDLGFSHITGSKNKGQAFVEYMKSKLTSVKADSRYAELESELAEVLKDVLDGLHKLAEFLDAVEKLAVTSLHVFTVNQMLKMPEGLSLDDVQAILMAARLLCPLILVFKRDVDVFFLPKLQNVDVLSYQLDKYIQTAKNIYERMDKSCIIDFPLKILSEDVVDLMGFSENDVQRMLDHIQQLDEIRMDPNFRTAFLFQEESCDDFIDELTERRPGMLQFLSELEASAVQLDSMNNGAKISRVVGSSVGAVGGVLSIVGLALSPVTAGVSLALTLTGVGMGITGGVNGIVTTATEVGINHAHQKKANEVFQKFMDDVAKIQECLEKVTQKVIHKMEDGGAEVALGLGKIVCKFGTVGRSIDSMVDAASAVKLLKNEELISSASRVVAQEGAALRNVPRVAAEIPDVGQAAAKSSLALTKTVRAGLIAVNALFLGMDVFLICKDSISLAKGSQTEASQFIRARSALWSAEMDSWEKIRESLGEALPTSGKKEAVLETLFYPDIEIEKQDV